MPLLITPADYLGTLLYVEPRYGWGWHGSNNKTIVDYIPIQEAGGFLIRVVRFYHFKGELRGLIGKVESAGHLLDDLWIICGAMLNGSFNLTDTLCSRYDLELGRVAPSSAEWPMYGSEDRTYEGYGVLAESRSHYESWSRSITENGNNRGG